MFFNKLNETYYHLNNNIDFINLESYNQTGHLLLFYNEITDFNFIFNYKTSFEKYEEYHFYFIEFFRLKNRVKTQFKYFFEKKTFRSYRIKSANFKNKSNTNKNTTDTFYDETNHILITRDFLLSMITSDFYKIFYILVNELKIIETILKVTNLRKENRMEIYFVLEYLGYFLHLNKERIFNHRNEENQDDFINENKELWKTVLIAKLLLKPLIEKFIADSNFKDILYFFDFITFLRIENDNLAKKFEFLDNFLISKTQFMINHKIKQPKEICYVIYDKLNVTDNEESTDLLVFYNQLGILYNLIYRHFMSGVLNSNLVVYNSKLDNLINNAHFTLEKEFVDEKNTFNRLLRDFFDEKRNIPVN